MTAYLSHISNEFPSEGEDIIAHVAGFRANKVFTLTVSNAVTGLSFNDTLSGIDGSPVTRLDSDSNGEAWIKYTIPFGASEGDGVTSLTDGVITLHFTQVCYINT